ncbi:MAG: DegV family protein [Lachnospiraceae bacterium]
MSKKIAIMTDSNSGITQAMANELGINVLPMPFMINEETFFEDITLTQSEFYERLEGNDNISTSQPSPESVVNAWKELLKEYDEIVHIPMSSGLSGSCETAFMLSKAFNNKVFVVDNQRVSVTQYKSVIDAISLREKGYTGEEIKNILEEDKFNSSIYIMLDTLYYLKKGGRITPAAAALGTILKLKPVLTIQGEKLDAFAKARTSSQGKNLMINAIKNDIETRFGGYDTSNISIQIAHSKNESAALSLKEELLELYPGQDIVIAPLSLSIACHIGPGSLAIACTKNLKDK